MWVFGEIKNGICTDSVLTARLTTQTPGRRSWTGKISFEKVPSDVRGTCGGESWLRYLSLSDYDQVSM